jgi:hypothetical protein
VAQKLEKALRDGEINVSPLLVEFASVMGTQVHVIEEALFASAVARTEEVRTWPFNREASAAAIVRLRSLLEANDGDNYADVIWCLIAYSSSSAFVLRFNVPIIRYL